MHIGFNSGAKLQLPTPTVPAPATKRGASSAVAALLLLLTLIGSSCSFDNSARARRERQWARNGKQLLRVHYQIPADAGARRAAFDREILAEWQFYARNRTNNQFLLIDADGNMHTAAGVGTEAWTGAELVLAGEHRLLVFSDQTFRSLPPQNWDVFWVSSNETAPPTRDELTLLLELDDGFMRHQLEDSRCRISAGKWQLNQHGGGLPETANAAENAGVQRSVNPFSAVGSDNGLLSYGSADWFHYHAEAAFYFGIPWLDKVVDRDTVPLQSTMMIVQGELDAAQVGFGWSGPDNGFILGLRRDQHAPWQILDKWDQKRPPLTNWIRIGLDIDAGYRANAWLDDVRVASVELPFLVRGGVHLQSGGAAIVVDDLRVRSLAASAADADVAAGTDYYVQSRNFAAKQVRAGSDPEQFEQWARASDSFLYSQNQQQVLMTTRLPMIGDFHYQAIPAAPDGSLLAPGSYTLRFFASDDRGAAGEKADLELNAHYDGDQWRITGIDGEPPGAALPPVLSTLRLRRRAAAGEHRLELHTGQHWLPLTNTRSLARPVFVQIALNAADNVQPKPEHHQLRIGNLVQELFESAPTDWRWIEGAFRMDTRWACADQWNFMACGAPAIPYMASRKRFAGNQIHEYYMSLRPVFPYDAGDPDFSYDPGSDHGWRIFGAHDGWYNRRDLNFSFNTNGRDILSGYSVVFGGDDNRQSRLLRRGQVVAATNEPKFLFRTEHSHHVIHWDWWKFTVKQLDNRIRVYLNDQLLFDYTDPEPITAGHIGFWTVRNGFTVAKVMSMAEQLTLAEHLFYITPDDASPWQPLRTDHVQLQAVSLAGSAATRVTPTVTGGFHAVRWQPPQPIDLHQQPVLELPLDVEDGTAVNLHLYIDEKSYLVQISAPLETKALLTPEYERGECFRIPLLTEQTVRQGMLLAAAVPNQQQILRINLLQALQALQKRRGSDVVATEATAQLISLTLGNSSNANYMLAGSGQGHVGGSYIVGTPAFGSEP